jgi:hypothetical protein
MNVPSKITKGVTLKWTESLSDYPASAWTLTYTFISPTDKQTVIAVADGDDYEIHLGFGDTALFNTGRYDWQAFVDDGTDRYCVGSGTTQVIEDFASQPNYDGRSQLQQIVDAMDAYLLGNATDDQQQVRFNDREIRKYDRAELLQLRNQLKRELKAEQIENELSAGTAKTKIRTRFL